MAYVLRGSGGTLLSGAGAALCQFLEVVGVDEARVRVAVHQRVDLQLRLVERVQRRVHHVAVDDLAHSRVQAHLLISNQRVTLTT